MENCPVCNANLHKDAERCPVCDTDLRVVKEMGRLPETFKQFAEEALESRNYARAQSYFQLALDLEPRAEDVMRGLARTQELNGEPKKALYTWQRLLQHSPDDPEVCERIKTLQALDLEGTERTGYATRSFRRSLRSYIPVVIIFTLLGWYGYKFSEIFVPFRAERPPGSVESDSTGPAETQTKIDTAKHPVPPASPDTQSVTTAKLAPTKSMETQGHQTHHSASGTQKAVSALLETSSVADQPTMPREASATAEFSARVEALAAKLTLELQPRIKVRAQNGGLFLEGEVRYPWQKLELEQSALAWDCVFVDLKAVTVKYPDALQYRIRKGDTLYGLARRFAGNGNKWPFLYQENSKVLTDPNRLEVGKKIVVHTKIP